MSTDKKLSNLIESQLPAFVREDHGTFVSFMEAYYEYLEQSNNITSFGKTTERAKNLLSYIDIDKTLDDFSSLLYKQFLTLIPESTIADKKIILKHVKDFYRARGTEKAYRFLIRIITGQEIDDFYFPKLDILRVSDGKWYIQKTLRVKNVTVDGNLDDSVAGLDLWVGTSIMGETSGASATIDQANQFYEQGVLINELTLSSIERTFSASESISTTYIKDDGTIGTLEAELFSGKVSDLTINDPGSAYSVGDLATITNLPGDTGSGAIVQVSNVSKGNIVNITVVYGGAGYRANTDFLLFTGGGGSGANAVVLTVDQSGNVHPNTYNIVSDQIIFEANTAIGNTIYTNLVSANANSTLDNALHHFLYTNTGPAVAIFVNNHGDDYVAVPTMSIVANTAISALGILGRMEIYNGGTGYVANNKIDFINVPGGHGVGGKANVLTVNGTGAITAVRFEATPGFLPGGSGYSQSFLPIANVGTVTGSGADIKVTAILGSNGILDATTSTIGQILELSLISAGQDYENPPFIDFSSEGDGTANVTSRVVQGIFTYPGRYLNDDGFLSSFNFLEDRDYYQNYSYVLKVRKSLDTYRAAVLKALHPGGMKLFGEFVYDHVATDGDVSVGGYYTNVQPSLYVVNAISFDGSTTYLKRNVGLDIAAGTRGVLSLWLNPSILPNVGGTQHVISFGKGANGNSYLGITNSYLSNANSGTGCYFDLRLGDANGVQTIRIISNANSHPIHENTWIHLITSWDTQNIANCAMRIDNVNSILTMANSSNSVVLNVANVLIGVRDDLTLFYDGALAEIFFTNAAMLLSNSAVITSFANNLLPQNLSNTIAATAYRGFYFRSNAASANLNSGAGGSFAQLSGTFTDYSPTPSDV